MDTRYLKIPESFIDDPRLKPMRGGHAAAALEGFVSADRYVDGEVHYVSVPVCVLRRAGAEDASAESQLLFGEEFIVYGKVDEWYWGQAVSDDYVGWVRKVHLEKGRRNATHWVMSRGTFVYSEPDLKSRSKMKIPMAARLIVDGEAVVRGTKYLHTSDGWVVARHVRGIDEYASDFVLVAESMVGMAYLWAGRSTFGLDCSGFIQLSMHMAGIATLRDCDMQEATIGEAVELHDDLRGLERGDLIFWPGHVGVMRDGETLLHSNGHTMSVFSEPLQEAVKRISYLYEQPRKATRPFSLSA